MPRFRWRHRKKGKLHIPGQPPRPDPRDPTRIIGGSPPKMIVFRPDGEDGIYDTEDAAEIAALHASLPAKRGMLTTGGRPLPPVRGPVPVVVSRTVPQALTAPLPYFEEAEPFDEVLAVVGRG
jgi:hypothetical protein